MATWNDYVRKDLKFETDLSYVFLSPEANRQWDWGPATGGMGYVNLATTLQQAMSENIFRFHTFRDQWRRKLHDETHIILC